MTHVGSDDPTLTPEDRDLIAAVHVWARTHGWTPHDWLGWINAANSTEATVAVRVERVGGCGITIFHRATPYDAWPIRGEFHQASCVGQAIDILVEQGIVPPFPWLGTTEGPRYHLTAAAYAALGA